MASKGNSKPVLQEEVLYRPMEPVQLFDNKVINSTTPQLSDPVDCHPYRHFGLFVYIDSTSSPDLLHIEVEFLDRWTGKWYTYKQGLFASLYYEDTDTASGIYELFQGMCAGRAMRVKLTGVNVANSGNELGATKYFTTSVAVEFWN